MLTLEEPADHNQEHYDKTCCADALQQHQRQTTHCAQANSTDEASKSKYPQICHEQQAQITEFVAGFASSLSVSLAHLMIMQSVSIDPCPPVMRNEGIQHPSWESKKDSIPVCQACWASFISS